MKLNTYGIPTSSATIINPVFLGSLPIKEDSNVEKMMEKEMKYFTSHGYECICFEIVR